MKEKLKCLRPRTACGQVTSQMVRRFFAHDVGRDSAALTYYLLFAIFPLMIFISTGIGILHLDVDSVVLHLEPVVPGAVLGVVNDYLRYVNANASRYLLWFSLVCSIWFPMRATACLMHSIRKAFYRPKPENPFRNLLFVFLFTLWLIMTIGASLLMILIGRQTLEFLSHFFTLSESLINAWSYLRFVLVFVLMAFAISALYMLSQGRRCPLREVLPGVLFSLVAWMVLSAAFSYYVSHLAHYAQLYGSIATIVVVLLWLYISAIVLILGAELAGTLAERRGDILPLTEERK